MGHSHRQCLSELGCCSVRTTIIPVQRALSSFRHSTNHSSSVDSGLVCTYRDFLIVRLDSNGNVQAGERFTLAADEGSFWALDPEGAEDNVGADFADYLKRALTGDAPLSNPADLAWFLAAYARTALKRVDEVGDMQTLATLRSALEQALGLSFDDEDGEHFFRSALVQTLFYGVFAAWVFWSEQNPNPARHRFTWRQAQWTLSVPMVRVLFQQLATPANLPAGLDEVLDWTDECSCPGRSHAVLQAVRSRRGCAVFL